MCAYFLYLILNILFMIFVLEGNLREISMLYVNFTSIFWCIYAYAYTMATLFVKFLSVPVGHRKLTPYKETLVSDVCLFKLRDSTHNIQI